MTIASADPVLAGRAPGVYPLAASYQGDGGTVIATSAMIVPPDDAADVGIGVIVPITAGALSEGLLTSEQLAELTAPDGDLTVQLDAVTGTAAILAVDPAVPAAIRVLGTSAPTTALEWLARLESIQNSRFALQFGDADVTAQLQAGLPQPLAPSSLITYMSPSDFAAPTPTPTATPVPTTPGTPTPTPTPTSTPQPSDSLPSTETLVAVGPATRPGRLLAGRRHRRRRHRVAPRCTRHRGRARDDDRPLVDDGGRSRRPFGLSPGSRRRRRGARLRQRRLVGPRRGVAER